MKNSEPIRVKINISRGRDWTTVCLCRLEFRSHVGVSSRGRALIRRDPTHGTSPMSNLNAIGQAVAAVPAHIHPPCFSSREEAKYPSRELHGLAQAAAGVALCCGRANLDRTFRNDFLPRRESLTHKTHLLKVIFKTVSAS